MSRVEVTVLEAALHKLEQVWRELAPTVAGSLAPGLERDEITAHSARYGLSLPADLIEFYTWHNGQLSDANIEILPALRALSLRESLELHQQLRAALTVVPNLSPMLQGAWVPLYSDDAGEFLFMSCEAEAAHAVYTFELEDLGATTTRFASLLCMTQTLTELYRSGVYISKNNVLNVNDLTAAERIIAAHNQLLPATDEPGEKHNQVSHTVSSDSPFDNVAANQLANELGSKEGLDRATRLMAAVAELGTATVTRAISGLSMGARDEIARSLGNARDRRATPLLLALLNDPENYVREAAAGAVGLSGDTTLGSELLPLLTSTNYNVRKAAIFSLGELKIAGAGTALLPSLKDANPAVRAAAAQAIGKIGEPVDITALAQQLRDQYPDAAYMAAVALGEIADVAAIQQLKIATQSPDTTLVRLAKTALEAFDTHSPTKSVE